MRGDLVYVDRVLVIRPVRHILRGVFFEPLGGKDRFGLVPWCIRLAAGEPLPRPRIHEHLWQVWQPYFEPLLLDVLKHDVFAMAGPVTSLDHFHSIVAYVLEANRFPIAPAILGVVLGGMLEENFITSMIKSNGDLSAFFARPIAAALGVTTMLVWFLPPVLRALRARRAAVPA